MRRHSRRPFFFMSSRVWIQIASVGVFDRAEFPPKILRLMFFWSQFYGPSAGYCT